MQHDLQILSSGHISVIFDSGIFQIYWSQKRPLAVNGLDQILKEIYAADFLNSIIKTNINFLLP